MTIHCKTENDLNPAAKSLLSAFPESRIFAFYGKMGAGKTTFIRAICKLLKVVDVVQSPTFAIVSAYNTVDSGTLFHFDFYRIGKIEEIYDIGYEDYFYSGDYCFIEWPEKISELLPPECVEVKIEETEPEGYRRFTF